jgi:XapX domain-containing protein
MKPFFFSFVVGCAVGLLYAAVRVKSPAPPVVALVGLLGMVLGEEFFQWVAPLVRSHWK